MSKFLYLFLFLSVSLWSQSCVASEPPTSTSDVNYEVVEETVVMTGLKEVYDTSFHREIRDVYFCEGHKLNLNLKMRKDESDSEAFFTVDIDATYDNSPLKLGAILGKLNTDDRDLDISFRYLCFNDQVALLIYAYPPGHGTVRESLIREVYIDLETGQILPEGRRAPK